MAYLYSMEPLTWWYKRTPGFVNHGWVVGDEWLETGVMTIALDDQCKKSQAVIEMDIDYILTGITKGGTP